MAPSPADPRGAAMDADENEDAWRVGGFRVAGVRSKVFAPPPGHPRRSAQGFLVSMERDDHTSAPSSPVRVSRGVAIDSPLRQLFPGNAAMHRAAERESARKARTTMKASIDDDDFGPISSPGDSHRRRRATLVRASASTPGRASASSQPASSLPSSPISPEAAQRAARRAHRKRLAQIVVKHWRWFARDALADLPVWAPFRRQTLLARALRSWVRTRAEARDARRVNARDAEEVRREEARRRREFAVTCLLRWEENARVAKHARRNAQTARKHALRRACGGRVPLVLPAWRDAVWRAHRRRLFALRAEGARARSLTKKAVEAWKRSLLDARVSSHLAEAQGLVHIAKHTANVMRAWFGEARRRRTARALVAARVESARDEASVKACFGFWEEWTQRRVAKHKVRASHRAVRSRFVRAVAFRGWALYAAYARECEAVGDVIAARHVNVVKLIAIRGWALAAIATKLARADRRYFVWTGTRCWREWCAMARDGAVARRVAYARGWAKDRRVLSDSLLAWRARAADAKSERIAFEMATEHDERRAMAWGIATWRAAIADVRLQASRSARAAAHAATRTISRAFERWRWISEAKARDAIADTFTLTWLAKRTMHRWRNQTERALMREAKRRVAARHHYRSVLRRVLTVSWPLFVKWSLMRGAVRAKAAGHFASVTRRKVFGVWCGPIVSAGRKDKLASQKASVMRDALLALKAFVSWRHWTQKRSLKKRALADADAHHGAVLLHRCVLGWEDWLSGKLARREVKDARVRAASGALGETKRFRLFAQWLELAREGAVFRVQAERADAHRDERAKVCAVLAWLDHVDARKKRRVDELAADGFRARRFKFDALEAWVRHVVYRRRRIAGYANAVTWRHVRTSRRVWKLWRAWMDRVGRKRAREAAAAATFRDRLVKDGARAWLSAGLESRDARTAASARNAAEHAAAALVRAGKFARRWRHKVLGARVGKARFQVSSLRVDSVDSGAGSASFVAEDPYRPRLVGGGFETSQSAAESAAPPVLQTPAPKAATPASKAETGFKGRHVQRTTPPGLPAPPSPWTRPPRTPASVTSASASTACESSSTSSVITAEDLKRHERVIVEHEALRTESSRLAAEARSIVGDGAEVDARRRALEAAASHLRQRRREMLPAVRAAAAALGEAVALSDRG